MNLRKEQIDWLCILICNFIGFMPFLYNLWTIKWIFSNKLIDHKWLIIDWKYKSKIFVWVSSKIRLFFDEFVLIGSHYCIKRVLSNIFLRLYTWLFAKQFIWKRNFLYLSFVLLAWLLFSFNPWLLLLWIPICFIGLLFGFLFFVLSLIIAELSFHFLVKGF